MRPILVIVVLAFGVAGGVATAPAFPDRQDPKSESSDSSSRSSNKRLTIEVTGGDNDVAVSNASVYVKFNEERVLRKDRKFALNVKTNRDGTAHIPDPPAGRVLIQIVADGWKSFGKYYDLKDPGTTIKIHLERPPKWY